MYLGHPVHSTNRQADAVI